MTIREAMLLLPFVSDTPQGLNMWDVKPTGDETIDVRKGRAHAAVLLHLMRRFNAPQLTFHVMTTWTDKNTGPESMKRGFLIELGKAIIAAPSEGATWLGHDAMPPRVALAQREALLGLPFVVERGDGTLDCWAVRPRGDYSEDGAAGRFYGARLCHAIRAARDPLLLAHVTRSTCDKSVDSSKDMAIRVGMAHVVTEVAMSSGETSTAYQECGLPLLDEYAREAGKDLAALAPVRTGS